MLRYSSVMPVYRHLFLLINTKHASACVTLCSVLFFGSRDQVQQDKAHECLCLPHLYAN